MKPPENLLTAWAQLFFNSVAAAGVERVIVSPGSRSTPFVAAAAAEPRLQLHDAIDERTAAFFALGQARATGRPSLLLCTSGTAGAHYLPAVIEAAEAAVPLLIVTADRPWELLHVGANQTIDQRLLFEGYARRVIDVGAPDPALSALRGLRRLAAQAVAASIAPVPGPVHLNFRARKPLEPALAQTPGAQELAAIVRELVDRPVAKAAAGEHALGSHTLKSLAGRCARVARGVIVGGPAAVGQAGARKAVAALQAATGYPLYAEATSQLRFTGAAWARRVDNLGWLYALPDYSAWRPDLIVQLGAAPTSGAWERLLDRHPDIERIVIAQWGWPDPQSTAAWVAHADIEVACRQLAEALSGAPVFAGEARLAFARALTEADATVQRVVDEAITASGELTEGAAVRQALESLPDSSWLVLGNSLPVRLVDAYCPGRLGDFRVVSQRGVSGIDGLNSGAAGVASSVDQAVLLITGDISFLHDIGGLALARSLRAPLVILVLNNAGGRIFEQLPIADNAPEALLRHFTTPHDFELAHAARLYGQAYERVATRQELAAAVAAGVRNKGCAIIEARVAPHNVATTSARIMSALKRAYGG
jgi:2-succinyl-5-enolpyruvyl-6-hydroxy-3-cyclohexene-1-carboxylate synthase